MIFSKLKISTKIIFTLLFFVTVGQIATSYYTRRHLKEEIKEQIDRELTQITEKHAKDISMVLSEALTVAKTMAGAIQSIVEQNVSVRGAYVDLLTKTAIKNNKYAGLGFLFEENLPFGDDDFYQNRQFYDKTGRNVAYIALEKGQPVRDTFLDYNDPWYQKPKKSKKPVIVEPTTDKINNRKVMVVTVAAPIFAGGQYMGIALTDLALEKLSARVEHIKILNNGSLSLLSDENAYIADADHSRFGKSVFDVIPELAKDKERLKNGDRFSFDTLSPVDNSVIKNYIVPIAVKDTDEIWKVLVSIPEKEVMGIIDNVSHDQLCASLLLIFFLYIIIIVTVKSVTTPVTEMTKVMLAIADGKNEEIPYQHRSDELGDMASAMQIFKDNSRKANEINEIRKQQEHMAEIELKKALIAIANSFESEIGGIVDQVALAVDNMQKSSMAMANMIDQAREQSTAGAKAAEKASDNIATMASASEELASSILEISRQVTVSSDIANQAVTTSEQTTATMDNLLQSANKIGEVIDLIRDIAEQTNMLALNATIEAARAGNSGKGFAVVASEVKSLSNQTEKATKDVSAQIADIQTIVSKAVVAIKKVNKTITDMNAITASISSAIEEQSAATKEISVSVVQTSKGASEVSDSMSESEKTIRDVADNAANFKQTSLQLAEQSEKLHQYIDNFIRKIKNDNQT